MTYMFYDLYSPRHFFLVIQSISALALYGSIPLHCLARDRALVKTSGRAFQPLSTAQTLARTTRVKSPSLITEPRHCLSAAEQTTKEILIAREQCEQGCQKFTCIVDDLIGKF